MPRPRLLPDPEVIRELQEEHEWTLREIGEHYKVSVSAVQKALRRADLVGPLITYREVVPWKVATRFADTAVMHHLRTMAQLQKGMEVPAVAKRRLHEWLRYLENNRLVLDYSPDCPPNEACSLGGFRYRPRRAEDQSFYRDPAGAGGLITTTGD